MSFIAELQRRRVFKVGAAYLVGGWVLIQVAATIAPQLKLPEWAPTLVTVLVGLGFPVALLLSWFFDITPQGIRRDTEAVSVAALAPVAREGAATSAGETRIDSIAVLPFQLRNSDADTEYLADGLGESLMYRLSRLSNLKVSPTSSVLRYRANDSDPLRAGHELGVSAVLTGRFSQRGDALTVSVELLDVRNDKLLWGERYDRRLADLLATQREIAAEIIDNLKPELSGSDRASLGKQYTNSNEAYQLYLKGRFHYAKRTRTDIERAVDLYRAAIAIDERFALAWVGIAEAWISMPAFSYLPSNEACPRAFAAARAALAIDPGLGSAHAALAVSMATHDWNWAEAGTEFQRALELEPQSADIHFRHGIAYLAPLGRLREAVAAVERALELEPRAMIIGTNLTLMYIYDRRFERALEQAQKTHALEPGFMVGRLALGFAYVFNAMYDEAIALADAESRDSSGYHWFLLFATHAYAKSGRTAQARERIAEYVERASKQYTGRYYEASMHAGVGDRGAAFAALDQACAERDFFVTRLNVDPFFDSVRDDPRMADLSRRMNLPTASS